MEYNPRIMLDTDAADTNAYYTRSHNDGATIYPGRYRSHRTNQSINQTNNTSSIILSSTALSVPLPLSFFPLPPSRCKYKRPAWIHHCLWMYLVIWFCYSATCKSCLYTILSFFVICNTFASHFKITAFSFPIHSNIYSL